MSWIKDFIADVPGFPEKGVIFKDITPLLASSRFVDAAKEMVENSKVNWEEVDAIAGIESRGFVFASAMSTLLGKGLVLIRKKGKLPPPFLAKLSTNEYAREVLEVKPGNKRILIVDDVLATGGTLQTAYELCCEAGYKVQGFSVLIDLPFLHESDYEIAGKSVSSLLVCDDTD